TCRMSRPRLMRHKLLIVDDEEATLFAMREYFSVRGFEVDCSRDKDEAVALLSRRAYGAVIADLRLTGSHSTEGLDIVEAVRERCPQTRTLLLTAYGSPEIEVHALRRGVDAFLHKPQPLPHVAKIVLELLGERRCAGDA
ncbi:MAG: response regulator, partial [Gemmatimonadota bacterium]|nr:response regulator [Gemmatimonadota bacterium]